MSLSARVQQTGRELVVEVRGLQWATLLLAASEVESLTLLNGDVV